MVFLLDRNQVVVRYVLERQAKELPGKECVLFEDGESWTYEQALSEGYAAANTLLGFGINRGDTVLVFLPNCPDFLRAMMGISFLGAIMVPVNTAFKGETLRHICTNSEARYIITTKDLSERLTVLDLNLKVIDPTVLKQGSQDAPKLEKPIEPWDISAIMYTSGTTGPAKGVLRTYNQDQCNTIHFREKATSADTFLIDHPLFHVAALVSVTGFWAVGARIAVVSGFSGSRYLDVIRSTGATMAQAIGTIPYFLESMPPQPNDADNPLVWLACSPFPKDIEGFKERFGLKDLVTAYGMSELNMPIYTQGQITNPKSCGKVRPGVEVRLVDDNDIEVPVGEPGELIVRSDRPWEITRGYFRNDQLTLKVWRNGWFHTGDLLIRDEEGNYFFADRKKDAIRRRGENISSFEVEREVMAYPHIQEVACVGVRGEFGEDEVKTFVVLREGCNFEPADLIKYLIPKMPHFMIPRYVEVVPELPKTQTMRVKKYEMREKGNSAATWDREAAGIAIK